MDRAVTWIKRWGISLCSLTLGLSTLLVFRRGLPHVSWIVGYLLILVLLVAAVAELRGPLEDRGRGLVLSAADYAVQTLYHALLAFSIFAALNVALPLLRLRPIVALETAAALTAVAMMPVFRERGALAWGQAALRSAGVGVIAVVLVWFARGTVPPAPLFVAQATVARSVTNLEPVDPIKSPIPVATVADWGGL